MPAIDLSLFRRDLERLAVGKAQRLTGDTVTMELRVVDPHGVDPVKITLFAPNHEALAAIGQKIVDSALAAMEGEDESYGPDGNALPHGRNDDTGLPDAADVNEASRFFGRAAPVEAAGR